MIVIYTDGACKKNKRGEDGASGIGGWAYVVLDKKGEFEDMEIVLSDSNFIIGTTNQEMEILAVAEAFKAIKNNYSRKNLIGKKIILYSDSAYVINCLKEKWYVKWQSNGWKNSKQNPVENKESWEKLLKSINGFNVDFFHVKRNSTKFITMADEMAKEASKIGTSQEL